MCNFFLVCKWKISVEVISSNIADDKIYSPWSFSWVSRVRYYCFVCSRAVKYEKYHVQFLRAIFLGSRRVIIPFRWGIWEKMVGRLTTSTARPYKWSHFPELKFCFCTVGLFCWILRYYNSIFSMVCVGDYHWNPKGKKRLLMFGSSFAMKYITYLECS